MRLVLACLAQVFLMINGCILPCSLPLEKSGGVLVNGRVYRESDGWLGVTDSLVTFQPLFVGGQSPFHLEVFGPVLKLGEVVEELYQTADVRSVTFAPKHSGIYRVVLTDNVGHSLEWSIGVAVIVE